MAISSDTRTVAHKVVAAVLLLALVGAGLPFGLVLFFAMGPALQLFPLTASTAVLVLVPLAAWTTAVLAAALELAGRRAGAIGLGATILTLLLGFWGFFTSPVMEPSYLIVALLWVGPIVLWVAVLALRPDASDHVPEPATALERSRKGEDQGSL